MQRNQKNKNNNNMSIQGYMKNIRNNIGQYMIKNNLSVNQLADKTGISVSTLSNILYTEPKDAKLTNVVKFCQATGMSLDELLDVGTVKDDYVQIIKKYKQLNPRSQKLVNWMLDHEIENNQKLKSDKYINVFTPDIDSSLHLKQSYNVECIQISDVPDDIRAKVFSGFRIGADFYMPKYTADDILLIANDRKPRQYDIALLLYGNSYYLAQKRVIHGIPKYYSIRDNQFRVDERDVEKIIGYVAYVL